MLHFPIGYNRIYMLVLGHEGGRPATGIGGDFQLIRKYQLKGLEWCRGLSLSSVPCLEEGGTVENAECAVTWLITY